jgi:hypothetical protein
MSQGELECDEMPTRLQVLLTGVAVEKGTKTVISVNFQRCPVDISWSRAPSEPQVGEMLTHWYNKRQHDHWAATAPVPGNWAAYGMEAQLGI